MTEQRKSINLLIAYSEKDEKHYKTFENNLTGLKEAGKIDSWIPRKLEGQSLKQDIIEDLETIDVILLLVSIDFLNHDYCSGLEINRAVAMHEIGDRDVIPILLRDADMGDAPFAHLKMLPSNGHPVISRYWKEKELPFTDIMDNLGRVLDKINKTAGGHCVPPDNTPLPYCIKNFSIKDFKCLKGVTVDADIPVNSPWVFITGKNGSGKTALLQALALGLLDNPGNYATHLLNDVDSTISIDCKVKKRDMFRKLYNRNGRWETEIDAGIDDITPVILLGYGVTRLNIQSEQVANSSMMDESKPVYSIFNETKGNFQNIEVWLKNQYLKSGLRDTPQIREVKRVLVSLMPEVTDIDIDRTGREPAIIYYENDFRALYKDLASGYKSTIAMVGDILVKIFSLNPELEKVGDFEGIIFIDELDLHLHPTWQRKLPPLLTELFEKVQFWATTHSIVPFMDAPEKSVFLTAERMDTDGTLLENITLDLTNISPNILISSPLFNLELHSVHNSDRSDFLTKDSYQHVQKDDELIRDLNKFADEKKEFMDDLDHLIDSDK